MSFLRAPIPREDESFLGFLQCFAEANALSTRELLLSIDARPAVRPLLDDASRVLERLTADPDRYQGMVPTWKEAGLLDRRFDRGHHDAVCPHCLGEAGLRRVAHRHRLVTVCDRHRLRLIDQCPGCRQPLKALETTGSMCSCGFDLSAAETQTASDYELLVAQVLARPDSHPALAAPSSDTPVGDFIWCLLRHGMAQVDGLALRVAPSSVSKVAALIHQGGLPLADWPSGLHQFLEARLDEGPTNTTGIAARLGGWYRALRQLDHPSLAPFWTELQSYVRNWDDVRYVGAGSGQSASAGGSEWITAKDAAMILGCRAERLRDAVRASRLPGRSRSSGLNYITTSLPRRDVHALQQQLSHHMTRRDACRRFGLSRKVIEALLEAGIITRGDRDHPLFAGLVDITGLLEAENCIGEVTSTSSPARDGKPLKCISKGSGGSVDQAVRLVTDLRSGTAQALWPEDEARKLGNCLICPPMSDGTINGTARTLTLSEAAAVTGWKSQVIARWCRDGFLNGEPVSDLKRVAYQIAIEDLLAFQRQYMPLSDLARQLGTTSRALKARLARRGVKVVGGWRDGQARRGELVTTREILSVFLNEGE